MASSLAVGGSCGVRRNKAPVSEGQSVFEILCTPCAIWPSVSHINKGNNRRESINEFISIHVPNF